MILLFVLSIMIYILMTGNKNKILLSYYTGVNPISVNYSIDGQCTETQDTTGMRHSYPWRIAF